MYSLVKPFLFLLPSEWSHYLGIQMVKLIGSLYRRGIWKRGHWATHGRLQTQTPFGQLTSPLGLAAGFDKNAEALWGWQALGFGFVEIGTVTPRPQDGNPRPRIFRYVRHRALINRMGFNSIGVKAVAANIRKARVQGLTIKIGGNIGKNAATPIDDAPRDYKIAAMEIIECVDYLVINVSSPNTPGLREMQSQDTLEAIVIGVKSISGSKPIFIKVAPDHFNRYMNGVIQIVNKHGLSGVICGNTLANHASATGLSDIDIVRLPPGGLSGAPIIEANLNLIKAYNKANPNLFLIGVGGIQDHKQAEQFIDSGAKLIQVYTALIYEGPSFVKTMLKDLVSIAMRRYP